MTYNMEDFLKDDLEVVQKIENPYYYTYDKEFKIYHIHHKGVNGSITLPKYSEDNILSEKGMDCLIENLNRNNSSFIFDGLNYIIEHQDELE